MVFYISTFFYLFVSLLWILLELQPSYVLQAQRSSVKSIVSSSEINGRDWLTTCVLSLLLQLKELLLQLLKLMFGLLKLSFRLFSVFYFIAVILSSFTEMLPFNQTVSGGLKWGLSFIKIGGSLGYFENWNSKVTFSGRSWSSQDFKR